MISRRLIRRTWPLFLALCIFSFLLFWNLAENSVQDEMLRDDWISVRLSKDQKEYVDRRGVHVVVGHYMGDTSSAKHLPNLTDVLNWSNNVPDLYRLPVPLCLQRPAVSSKGTMKVQY